MDTDKLQREELPAGNSTMALSGCPRQSSGAEKEKLARQVLADSRNQLYLGMQFLEPVIGQLRFGVHKAVRTIATDGENVWFQPDFILTEYRKSPVSINRHLFHLILHGVFRHLPSRRKLMTMDEVELEDWNLSCDIAVEALIDKMDVPCIYRPLVEVREEVYCDILSRQKLLNAESIFRDFQTSPPNPERVLRLRQMFELDDHSQWQFQDRNSSETGQSDGNQGQEQTEQTKEQVQRRQQLFYEKREKNLEKWEELSSRLQTALETRYQDKADPALSGALRITNRRKYDYVAFLRRFLIRREILKADLDSFDPIFYYYGWEHYKNMPLIEPLESSELLSVSELVVVIDTSGSCSGALVNHFLDVTFRMLLEQQMDGHGMNLHIIQADDQIQEDVVIHNRKELLEYQEHFQIKGHGDTDFRPAVEYVNRMVEEGKFRDFKGVIYFTDGYGLFPQRRTGYPLAFVFLEEDGKQIQVPPWAMKVILSGEDIEQS